MSEPVSAVFGVQLSSAIAGFAGGVVSLSFLQGVTRKQAAMAVIAGSLSAAYLTPAAAAKLAISAELQNGAAFVIGLCAMSILPAILKAVAQRSSRYADPPADPKKGTDP